jgi:putative hydrolase of the HAD superfamily
MKPLAVFFDMDDTLLDTSGALEESWEEACREYASRLGCEWTALRAAIRRAASEFWKDESLMAAWRVNLAGARTEVVRLALTAEGLDCVHAQGLADHYATTQRGRMRLFEDSIATLEALRAGGMRLGLLTNGPAELQQWKIQQFGIAPYFDIIVIEGAFGMGKPERAVFEHALAVTGATPAQAWHIGDNLYADIGGAQGAGIHAVWIHRDRLELGEDAKAIPDRVIGHLHEIRAELCGA